MLLMDEPGPEARQILQVAVSCWIMGRDLLGSIQGQPVVWDDNFNS